MRLQRVRFMRILAYVLTTAALAVACTDPIEIGTPAATAFVAQPTTSQTGQAIPATIKVQIQDADGNIVINANNKVTLELGTAPGDLILHTSGKDSTSTFVELIDPRVPLRFPVLSDSHRTEIRGLLYDSSSRKVLSLRKENVGGVTFMFMDFLDPVTGAFTNAGRDTSSVFHKGLEWDGMGTIVTGDASVSHGGAIYRIDPTDWSVTLIGKATTTGGAAIAQIQDWARDPTDGTLYANAALNPAAFTTRSLVTYDVATNQITTGVPFQLTHVSSITFLQDGTLMAMTGKKGAAPQRLWAVDKTTGQMVQVIDLTDPAGGEEIVRVPPQVRGRIRARAIDGIATFDSVAVLGVGNGYTLRARVSGLTAGTSQAFNVTP